MDIRLLERLLRNTLHVVVDMQAIFAEPTEWYTAGLLDILPQVLELTRARIDRTLFARFMTPSRPGAAQGRWETFYQHHASVTELPPRFLELVEPLRSLASPATVIDKNTYSVFGAPAFEAYLAASRIDTLVITGVETDVCVLASVFDAVDRGLRVIIPADAVASSSAEGHSAVVTRILPRLKHQIDVSTVPLVLEAWAV